MKKRVNPIAEPVIVDAKECVYFLDKFFEIWKDFPNKKEYNKAEFEDYYHSFSVYNGLRKEILNQPNFALLFLRLADSISLEYWGIDFKRFESKISVKCTPYEFCDWFVIKKQIFTGGTFAWFSKEVHQQFVLMFPDKKRGEHAYFYG